ncbi:MAG: hypothetical protein ABMB14_21060 [Myxococcota bacterium]
MIGALEGGPDGLVGWSLGANLFGRAYRTLTVWESEEEMGALVISDPHLRAMAQVGTIADPDRTIRTGYWDIDGADVPPDWSDVVRNWTGRREGR